MPITPKSGSLLHADSQFDDTIASVLKDSRLFLALVSADYLASNYCYEREFQHALELAAAGSPSNHSHNPPTV
jgi:hypothetical protein